VKRLETTRFKSLGEQENQRHKQDSQNLLKLPMPEGNKSLELNFNNESYLSPSLGR
jgi:hypothetical protein